MTSSKNPVKLQSSPRNQRGVKIPLVLIHDGGGTTFAYHCLGSLNRDVYAIHNPKYETGEVWENGMKEMAQCYIKLLIDAGIEGPIILGGWSLGGLLSLQIVHMLSQENHVAQPKFFVEGLLLVDTTFHVPWKDFSRVRKPDLPPMPNLVRLALDQCTGLLNTWELPEWDENCDTAHERCDSILPLDHIYHQPLVGTGFEVPIHRSPIPIAIQESRNMKSKSLTTTGFHGSGSRKPPPAVLIRAMEKVPDKMNSGLPARVDLFRDHLMLGWEFSKPDFINWVIDVDGSHYDMFAFSKVKVLTERFNQALKLLGH